MVALVFDLIVLAAIVYKSDYVAKSGMDKRMLLYRRRLGDRLGNRQPLASASRGGRDGTVFHDPPSQTLPHYL